MSVKLRTLIPWQSGHVACAYYDPSKRLLYVLEDTQETLHYDLTRMRKLWRQRGCFLQTSRLHSAGSGKARYRIDKLQSRWNILRRGKRPQCVRSSANMVICVLIVKFTSGFCFGYISDSSLQGVHGFQGARQALVSQSVDGFFHRRHRLAAVVRQWLEFVSFSQRI